MSGLRVLELFGGIGACTQALKRMSIEHEIADYVEIDEHACKSFNAINGTDFEPQDICEWDKDIEVDLLFHGSPCQDFSLAGLQGGGDAESGTRSSLMWETVRIVNKLRPKYVVWENVKNVVSKNHVHNFDKYIDALADMGYDSKWSILNAKDYGVAQNRERIFVVSILGDNDFEFGQKMELDKCLDDYLDQEVDEKFFVNTDKAEQLIQKLKDNGEI